MRTTIVRLLTLALLLLTGCQVLENLASAARNGAPQPESTAQAVATPQAIIEVLRPEVISVRPHDRGAFTQGLVLHDGRFYESTGLNGQSTLREVDPLTGEVLRVTALADEYFGEGLALVADRLIQITWQNREAFVYDLATFERVGTFTYEGEGWGLCYDGTDLYMSDGSEYLFVRDPQTFALRRQFRVALDGQAVNNLNELECVGESVFANVWQTDYIVRIDKASGAITAVIDASDLLTQEDRAGGVDVLNGIAYNPEDETFFITGKLWPKLFEVRFVPLAE